MRQGERASIQDIKAQLQRTLRVAREEDYPPVEVEKYSQAFATTGARKAMGINSVGPLDVARLPQEARQEVLDMASDCEQRGF